MHAGRRECRSSLPGILMQGDQLTFRSANMISNWLSTMSQFWHLACQCLTIRCDARYNIRLRESSLVKDGLFFVICRNCCPIRFNGLPVSDERCGQFG